MAIERMELQTIAKGYLEKGGSVAQFQALLDDVGSTGALTEAAKVELKRTFGDMAEVDRVIARRLDTGNRVACERRC